MGIYEFLQHVKVASIFRVPNPRAYPFLNGCKRTYRRDKKAQRLFYQFNGENSRQFINNMEKYYISFRVKNCLDKRDHYTSDLKNIDEKIYNHILSILLKPGNPTLLSKRDSEVIHFLL